jgi:exoribonuclease-2
MVVGGDGAISSTGIYRALVRNQSQLTYSAVGSWLDGSSAAPAKVAASVALQAQLKLQDEAAQSLLDERYRLGALNIDRVEAEAVITDGQVQGINARKKNRASDLIENFMVAANGVMARKLTEAGVCSIRRVVRTPERWPRIVELAARYGESLPIQPDSGALNAFLQKRKAADAVHYADVSLAVVKLMGPGEYVLSRPDGDQPGHFALAASRDNPIWNANCISPDAIMASNTAIFVCDGVSETCPLRIPSRWNMGHRPFDSPLS